MCMEQMEQDLAAMFSDYIQKKENVDTGWEKIANHILGYIKDRAVTDPGLISEYLTSSQGDKCRAREVIKGFFDYYKGETGMPVYSDIEEPVLIDNTFLRRLEILKYLHDRHTTSEIEKHFGVTTITDDLNAIRSGFGFPKVILRANDESEGRERRKHYRSNVHPILLALNSTEVVAMTVKLMQIAEEEGLTDVFNPIISKIYAQLSDYAKDVLIKTVDPEFTEKVHEKGTAFRDEEEWIMSDEDRRESYATKMIYLIKSQSCCDFVISTKSGKRILENSRVIACEGTDRYVIAYQNKDQNEVIPIRVKDIDSLVIKEEYRIN